MDRINTFFKQFFILIAILSASLSSSAQAVKQGAGTKSLIEKQVLTKSQLNAEPGQLKNAGSAVSNAHKQIIPPRDHPSSEKTGINWLQSTSNARSLAYIENLGQCDGIDGVKASDILYTVMDKGIQFYFTKKGLIYKLYTREKVSEREWERFAKENKIQEEKNGESDREGKNGHFIPKEALVQMNWEGSDPEVTITGTSALSSYFNYYNPKKDKNKIIGNVRGFQKITYKNLYPNIDAEYTIHEGSGIEYAYILHPGADPRSIKMVYSGTKLKLEAGNILMSTPLGNITDHAPETFLGSVSGSKIGSAFAITSENTVGFRLSTREEKITELTVIDPWTVGTPTLVNENTLDIATDPSSNVIVYSQDPAAHSYVTKFNSAGVKQWTLDMNTNYDYYGGTQGDVGADNSNNVYVTIGLGPDIDYNTVKINPAGNTLLWGNFTGYSTQQLYESWNISFNCDQSQLIQSGGGIDNGTVYYNVSSYETLNTTNGNEGALHEDDALGDIYASLWAPSGLMYHLCSDKNTGSTRGGAPTTGAANHLICVDPSSGFSRTFTVNTGYSYVDADFKGGNSVGMNAIASSCTFLYTTDGKFVDKWDLLTGAHFTQVTVPGGSHSVGSVNSGIVCDKCGNVYVGSNGTVKVFDANLALINTIGGLPDVVSDMVWGKNGELFVCGGTSGSSPFVTSISVATCSLGSSGLSLAVTQPTCGSPLGVCTATVSFCGAPYSYSWSDGSSTQTVSTLGPGTYTVSVTGSVTCPFAYADINTFTINAIPNTVTGSIAAPTDVNCNGACNGSATITPGGGTGAGTYGFAWSPSGGSGATASSLCANTYTCVITDGNGCTNTQTTIINQPSALTSSKVSHTDVLCTGSSTGDATVSAANGSGGYSYTWSPAPGGGQGTVTATGLPANVAYTCTIHDAHGCSSTQAFTLTQPVTVLSSSKAGHTDILCTGGSTGDATVAAANGAGGYTYTWSPAPAGGQGTVKATGLPANVAYTCTIHDANGCTTTQAFTLSEPVTVLSSSIAGHTDILCKGSSTGDATVSAANGAGGYSYTWSPAPSGGQGTITATGLPANIAYTCNIHDVNGCLTSQTLTLVQPGTSLSIASQSSTVTGCGTSTGTATVSASGGTGVDSYTWAPAPAGGQGTATATGLSASNYTVTVHDANGCPITQTYAIGTAGGPSVTATALANAKCNVSCDGTVKANPTGGTGAGTYTYSWSGGAGTLATASSLCAGTYTCTIHDANNCLITLTSTITAPTVLAASSGSITPATCNGASTATATVAVTGGTGIYTYSWTGGAIGGGQGTSTATGLAPLVTYTCTVNDANSCVSSQTFTTTQPTVLTATPSSSTLTGCGTSVGTATVAAGGGTGADTYTWSGGVIGGGQGTTTATGLAAGTYTVTVHDTKNCPASTTYAITAAGGPSLLSSTFANAKCNTSCDGTASVTATGGTGAYTYAWTPSGGTAASASALCANTYTCKITDNNNCSTSQSFIVTAPTVLTASSSSQTNVLCTGSATGNATVSASGGAGTYTYLWTGGTITSGQGTASASGLTNGTYTCTVKDANACPASHVFTISQPITALSSSQFSQTNVACMGTSTGKATVAAAGGTGAYTYAWTGGTITSGQGTTAVSGLASGTYTCNITDGNTCQSSQIFTISQPPTGVSSVPFSQTNVLCTGFTTGAATVSVSGGTGAYTYAWTGGTITTGQGTATASGLAQGTYVCNITDAGGCPTSQSFTLTQPATSLSALPFSQTNVDCKGNSSASATVQASGGTVLYTYAWSGGTITGGQGTATATGLAQGTYICNINDANGCITSQSFTLTQPAFVLSSTAVQTNVSCNGGSSGSATISPAGGTAGYTYNWSSPAVSTTATASGLAQGTYSCTVTDANNCTTIQSLTITQPAVLSGTGTPVSSTCNLNNGTASVSPAGGSPQYTYSWSSGGATASTSGLVAGNYSCTITDSLACTTVVPVAITNVGSNPVAVVNPTGSVSFCQGQSTLFAASGGTSYSWNTGSVNNFISVSTPGTYTAYVTNSCGIDSAYGIATMNPLPVPAISGKDTLCKGDSVLLIASGGASYLWSNGSTSAAIYVSNTGNYTVSATNTCGSVSASLPVFVSSVTADFIPSSTSGSHPLPVTFKDSSSASAITWAWNFGDGSTGTGQFGNDYTYNTAGTYTVTLTTTNAQHCTSSHSEVIVVSEINSWLLPANVFTPNGDGVNDNWVVNAGGIDYFDGKIFDRWGVAMAQLVSSNEVWDGRTMGGLLASHGTYYYIIHAKGEDGKIYNLTGFIELIR